MQEQVATYKKNYINSTLQCGLVIMTGGSWLNKTNISKSCSLLPSTSYVVNEFTMMNNETDMHAGL